MSGHVVIPFHREFPHPIDAVYAWLTDYSEEDPAHARSVILKERRVLERDERRVLLEVKNVALGQPMVGKAEVSLYPEAHRWEARGLGRGRGVHYTYQLTALGPSRTRIDVQYSHFVKRWRRRLVMRLSKPLIRRELARMWAGFADAMARDLGESASEPGALAARQQ